MKPNERLKEIKKHDWQPDQMMTGEYWNWLINRVHRLTEALEFYASGEHREAANVPSEDGYVARKALEGEE